MMLFPVRTVSGRDAATAATAAAALALAVAMFGWAGAVRAADETFVRTVRDRAGEPVALEVAIARFKHESGARVDLVGAVHVAEPAYFRALDARLAGYEAVLYELVGEPGATVPPPGASPSIVGLLQGGMKDALGLAFQLEEIDYSRSNFVHADLTRREFSQSMRERDESLMGLLFRAWVLGMAEQSRRGPAAGQADLLKVLFAEDRQLALKRLLAAQLSDQADLLRMISGKDGSTLIEVRNARALEVLERELAAGRRRIAIFYGAGHLPDLAERLQREFELQRTGIEWLEAWDLRSSE
ncbi:MAG: hypothetical protein RQ847_05185 [Wenzhouxiangellaceae bacterium]|nr:hypothetical protein [Wenzhouxiangellaceae bacterium]